MKRQKRKSLKVREAENSIKPKGRSKYALKKARQRKGKYSPDSPIKEDNYGKQKMVSS